MKPSELLSDPKAWTRRTMARNKYSREVEPDSPTACKWCLAGALMRCDLWKNEVANRIRDVLEIRFPECGRCLPDFNDDIATHADVLAVLKECGL